ncbi:MAG: copper chaperone PCu(A)C [Sedimentitalea sp.]
MSFKTRAFVALALCIAASGAIAGDAIMIKDAYARASSANATSGAAFMMIMNHSGQDDRLVAAASGVAKRVELHTHIETGDGVMQMREIEGGIALPAGAMHMMKRGGDHVMFMGLTQSLVQGDMVDVTLVFEKAGEIKVRIPVDLTRKPGAHSGHGSGG